MPLESVRVSIKSRCRSERGHTGMDAVQNETVIVEF